jgi:hypothetical protein
VKEGVPEAFGTSDSECATIVTDSYVRRIFSPAHRFVRKFLASVRRLHNSHRSNQYYSSSRLMSTSLSPSSSLPLSLSYDLLPAINACMSSSLLLLHTCNHNRSRSRGAQGRSFPSNSGTVRNHLLSRHSPSDARLLLPLLLQSSERQPLSPCRAA